MCVLTLGLGKHGPQTVEREPHHLPHDTHPRKDLGLWASANLNHLSRGTLTPAPAKMSHLTSPHLVISLFLCFHKPFSP